MTSFHRLGTLTLLLLLGPVFGCSQEVKIGGLISETGSVAPYGKNVKRGIDLALAEINAEGGFGGPITMVYRDDGSTPGLGQTAITELIEQEGVRVVIGAVSSAVTMAVAPTCEKERVILLSPSSSAPEISTAGAYIFRNYPSDILEGTSMADFAKGQGIKRVVLIALDNAFGQGLTSVFRRQFESKSRKIIESFDIDEGDDDALDDIVNQVKELQPEGIYIVAYVNEMTELLTRLRGEGIESVIMSSAAVMDQLLHKAGEAAEYLVYSQPSFDVESDDDVVRAFAEAYQARYGETPDIWAAHGYDSLKLLVHAMQRTESSHPDDIKLGLLGTVGYHGAAGLTAFDERGDVVRYPKLFIVHEGRSVTFERFDQEGGKLPVPGR